MFRKTVSLRSSKNVSAVVSAMALSLFLLIFSGHTAYAVDGPHGDERIRSPKGVCATCHIPHNAKGRKIWARAGQKPDIYGGVRQLCQTCHDGTMFYNGEGNIYTIEEYTSGDYGPPYKGEFGVKINDKGEKEVYASSGTDDVLDDMDGKYLSESQELSGPYESHVMHGGANLNGDSLTINILDYPDIFPLDSTDKDNYPEDPAPSKYREGSPGFYCGTCHNPHKQPDNNFTGGFYLRKFEDTTVGDPWYNRKPFCIQCHKENIHATKLDCLYCHHPHLGKTLIKENEKLGRKIFRYTVTETEFIAIPNVPKINDAVTYTQEDKWSSSFCYGCHNAKPGNKWTEVGAVPIYGYGDNTSEEIKRLHHPMGTEACLNDTMKAPYGFFIRAPGINTLFEGIPDILNENNELTCTSCHLEAHGPGPYANQQDGIEKSRKNNFLRWDFENDNPEYCTKCHSDKTDPSTGKTLLLGKHLQDRNSAAERKVIRETFLFDPNIGIIKQDIGSANCMFCHFIHDGEKGDDVAPHETIRADIDTLMRIEPKNMAWGERSDDRDLYDYEDMCYGCHGDLLIVGEQGSGSLLKPDGYYTHPFAIDPNIDIDTDIFPVSDYEGTDVPNDYGTQGGKIFCGTCHNVHVGTNQPYLRSNLSPYSADGFCEGCHDQDDFVSHSHPVNLGPNWNPQNGSVTKKEFDPNFYSGGSGNPGGITYPYDPAESQSAKGGKGNVICLTCHNTHAALTSPNGESLNDFSQVHGKLLIMDNLPNSLDPEEKLCLGCHDKEMFLVDGPHTLDGLPDMDWFPGKKENGICHNCHTPHNAKSSVKIWAIDLERQEGVFAGVHELCYSCHNPSNEEYITSGIDNVFAKAEYENHVMFGGAAVKIRWCPENKKTVLSHDLDTSVFPLDPNDYDSIPLKNDGTYCGSSAFSYNKGGEGFYCGSCHNPHKNPQADGDYLRSVNTSISIGDPGKRKTFCIQCHDENIHSDSSADPNIPGTECLTCHHPHKGKTLIDDDERMGRLILSFTRKSFSALPNVPVIEDDPNHDKDSSSICYGCHNPQRGIAEGIKVIYGDDAGAERKEHHPMGTQASMTDPEKFINGKFIRAPSTTPAYLNKKGQITCTSCHYAHYRRQNLYFFRADFTNDAPDLCILCHDNKTGDALGSVQGRGHRQSFGESPNGRGNCMFCHFIHDGEERQADITPGVLIRPDVDSLMRVPAADLIWDDQGRHGEYDYEDLCFGCHSKTEIVCPDPETGGSLLDPNTYFTHPFAIPENPGLMGEGFQASDGPEGVGVPDDYGTEPGKIYCGTCHDVHVRTEGLPYLSINASPYKAYGFCEGCHNKSGEFVSKSHPINVSPNPDPAQGRPTAAEFVDTYNGRKPLFSSGGSGRPGGVTSPYNPVEGKSELGGKGKVICLTCHNTHAAVTSWKGATKTDSGLNHGYLLVKDNMKQQREISPGSELCKACHPFGDTEYDFPSGDHGGGDLSNEDRGICNACHKPHDSFGPKLWSMQDYRLGPFLGARQLCFTCHRPYSQATTGRNTVFKGADLGEPLPEIYLEDHVMGQWADIDNVGFYDPNHFPLDPNNEDTLPACTPEYSSQDGFYCGSCHNPHLQQGGRYLRSSDGNAGSPGYRKNFCNDCHTGDHNRDKECLGCHHPHQGMTSICDDPNIGRLVYIREFNSRYFLAKPNVNGFTGQDVSATCYGCHGPHVQDPNSPGWSELGATIIYGDFEGDGDIQAREKASGWVPREHHPMGKQARFGQPLRAPGADRGLFNKHGELTCTSCHSGNHEGERENNFLRWDFTRDNSHFCLRCHTDKGEQLLGPVGWGHHQTTENSPITRTVNERIEIDGEDIYKDTKVRCANCMFCHFIHDGEDSGDSSTPALEALMRVKPVNLGWADAWQDTDTEDYEDLCYGCHSKQGIVKGLGGAGALLISFQDLTPDMASDPLLGQRFSHRFRSAPNPLSPTALRLQAEGPFPLSDGKGEKVLDDYGTEAGSMYCGTCHDVHTWAANPGTKYLRGLTSPYTAAGFCSECHSADPAPSVCTPAINHRLAPAPNGTVSVLEWSPLLYSNVDPAMPRGRGEKGGFMAVPKGLTPNVGQMTCLTCHNIHAAETTYDGHVDHPHSDDTAIVDGRHGKLLIIDNGHGPAGSDLCINCHPDHSQIIGSPHDFSHRGLDGLGAGIADKGVCFACHRTHIALDEKLLWARPMGEEKVMFGSVPGFALGSTIYCYDCHSGIWCDPDPLPDLFLPFPPQDVAFMDGPGGIVAGYYEPLPAFVQDIPPHRIPSGMPTEIKTSGHYIRQPILTTGIAQNDKLPCNDCHNPHRGITKEGIPNQAFIKAVLGGKPIGPYKASINMRYHKEIRNNLESRQACVACHGLADRPNAPVYPPAAFGDINPLYSSILPVARPTTTVYDHFDLGLYACTDCHRHNRAMVLCIDCHGYPPTTVGDGWSGPGDTDQSYIGGAGAHYKHVIEHQFTCTMCHLGCLHDPGGATVVNPVFKRAKISIDFDMSYKFPRTSGEFQTRMAYYGTNGKLQIAPMYDPTKLTCYVGCHNPLVADPDEIPNLDNPSPSWSLQIPQVPTPPSLPSADIPSWITVRMPYAVPTGLPDIWQIPWPGM